MFSYIKNMKLLLLVFLLIVFISSTAAAATSVTEVEYVRYERSDGNKIIVDYQKALEQYDPPLKREPLKKALQEIEVALYNFRQVYVQTEDKIINYSDAVNDGKTFNQAMASKDYDEEDIDLFEEADLELYSATGNIWAYRTPQPQEFPEDIEVNVAWSVFARCWFVNVIVDTDVYPLEVNAVRVMGKTAVRGPGVTDNYWRARIYESDLPTGVSEPRIDPSTVKILYSGSWLW